MLAPILLGELFLGLEELNSKLPLEKSHDIRNRILRRERQNHVHMVRLDINLFNLDLVFLAAEAVKFIANHHFSPSVQDLVAKFGAEYNMVGTQPDTV